MKVIISMSGLSSRFSKAGYTIPKFMIDIDGKKVIQHIIDLYPKDSDFLFIINDKHAENTDIVELLEDSVDKKNIVVIPRHKKGPVFSIKNFEDYIKDKKIKNVANKLLNIFAIIMPLITIIGIYNLS